MASASAKTNANYLALELAAPFVCPRIGALAATCKELRTASLSTITWTPFFRRRWPCLAAVEHFAAAGFVCPQYANPADYFFMHVLSADGVIPACKTLDCVAVFGAQFGRARS